MLKIKINGKNIKAKEGATVLEVARANGIDIPTLCSNDALKSYGACRMCIVEVENNKRTTIEAACTFPVADGMSVDTKSERVIAGRKLVIELLLSRCPNVKVVWRNSRSLKCTCCTCVPALTSPLA